MKQLILFFALLAAPFISPSGAKAQNYEQIFTEFRASELSKEDKRFLQTALAFKGHYNGLLDGAWGQISQRALNQYTWREFGSTAEDWHMAALAFDFSEEFERDGWEIRYFDGLEMSFLFPKRAFYSEPESENFLNWRHSRSSLGFSIGIHDLNTVRRIHDYVIDSNSRISEPYIVRRENLSISTAFQTDGTRLYARSNFINGVWSTVMISAKESDERLLNAVAASISVGYSQPISLSRNGKLASIITETLAFLEDYDETQAVSQAPQETPAIVGSGSGFHVSIDGHILTNHHVVDGCSQVRVDEHVFEVIAENKNFDLALLKGQNGLPVAVAEFSPTPAKLNSDVTVVGYPLASILKNLNVTRGAVSSEFGFQGDATRMQISAPVQSGNSGGPVIGPDGNVVGVVVSKLNEVEVAEALGDTPQNVNFAIRGEIAKLFLSLHGVDPKLGDPSLEISPVDLAEKASQYTVFIECIR